MDELDRILAQAQQNAPIDPNRQPVVDRQAIAQRLLRGLNPQQAEAVQHDKGPLLILAGAGSGKTRVITHRVAWLVSVQHVRPSAILAITFTNKAAAEMKTRIEHLIGPVSRSMWIGTFHAMLMRILRRFADRIGFSRDFTILDTDDQQKIVKQCLAELNLDEKTFAIRAVHSQISTAKNNLTSVEQFTRQSGSDYFRSQVGQVYKRYQDVLRKNNSMDFDDILYEAVRLLESCPDVLAEYQDRFEYILVDEYQDTNHAQYRLVHLLSARHKNLCVVGDDDQSIYSFRGANIQNILDFEKDFKRCKVIKLEQNYRSTGHVLKAANAVIGHNQGRKEKALWTESADGEKITFLHAEDQNEEGRFIAREIERQVSALREKRYRDFAILYRLNALSRTVEQALREQGIPYRIYGGTRFYDRKEIKDVLAYLRLIVMPQDDISFNRVINVPRRGIGDVTLEALTAIAAQEDLPLMTVCAQAIRYPQLQRMAARLMAFSELIKRLQDDLQGGGKTFAEYIDWVEQETGLIDDLVEQQQRLGKHDIIDRIENLKELLSDAMEFESQLEQLREEGADLPPEDEVLLAEGLPQVLQAFLERAALYSEIDQDKEEDDVVRLLTIHSAKGLEFDTVFLVGAEEGLFPGYRSMGSQEDMEEERRLAYVAITRARHKLYITTTRTRLIFGQTQRYVVSLFVREIPDLHMEDIGGSHRSASAGNSADLLRRHERVQFPGAPEPFLKKSAQPQRQEPSISGPAVRYAPGDQVQHPRFGKGRVVSADPVAGDAILVIDFDQAGRKRFLAKMAGLHKTEG
ncbi:MAG: UvrD-helicase domain-containing protein [Ruminococcaceae bacterium]|nr:UvrD-helicase domain-containing protein [Oscillospiraceae bacterium]